MSQKTEALWFSSPPGKHLLAWEQECFDAMVSDIFGYNAVQVGLPAQDFLRNSRISYRFHGAESGAVSARLHAYSLPFATASLDLVLLPHVLEFSDYPHEVLREVERVLVPEGSVIIASFNPYSLWGWHRALVHRCGAYPWQGRYLSVRRIKDWLSLLGLDSQRGAFGCYIPAVKSQAWIRRWQFMDKAGNRWWPVCGAVYVLQGIKRVNGMRLLTPGWRLGKKTTRGLRPAVQRQEK